MEDSIKKARNKKIVIVCLIGAILLFVLYFLIDRNILKDDIDKPLSDIEYGTVLNFEYKEGKIDIYRSLKEDGEFKKIDTVYTNTYIDKNTELGKKYYYKVQVENEELSDIITCTSNIFPPIVEVDRYSDKVVFKLDNLLYNGYKIYKEVNGNYKILKTVGSKNKTYEEKIDYNKKYNFRIQNYAKTVDGSYESDYVYLNLLEGIENPELKLESNEKEIKLNILSSDAEKDKDIDILLLKNSSNKWEKMDSLEFKDNNVTLGKSYKYTVKLEKKVNNIKYLTKEVTGKVKVLPATPVLTLKENTDGNVEVRIENDILLNNKTYKVTLSKSEDGETFEKLESKNTKGVYTYLDKDVYSDTTYYYKGIITVDNVDSKEIVEKISIDLKEPLEVPDISIERYYTQVNIKFAKNDKTGINIYKSEDGKTFKLLKSIDKETLKYIDYEINCDKEYYYKAENYFKSKNKSYSSDFTEVLKVDKYLEAPTINLTTDDEKVGVILTSENYGSVRVDKYVNSKWTTIGSKATVYDKDIVIGNEYKYRVRNIKTDGKVTYYSKFTSKSIVANISPGTITLEEKNNNVMITVKKTKVLSTDYKVLIYRSTDNKNFTKLKEDKINGTFAYTDELVNENTTYYYYAEIINGKGSSKTNVKSIKTSKLTGKDLVISAVKTKLDKKGFDTYVNNSIYAIIDKIYENYSDWNYNLGYIGIPSADTIVNTFVVNPLDKITKITAIDSTYPNYQEWYNLNAKGGKIINKNGNFEIEFLKTDNESRNIKYLLHELVKTTQKNCVDFMVDAEGAFITDFLNDYKSGSYSITGAYNNNHYMYNTINANYVGPEHAFVVLVSIIGYEDAIKWTNTTYSNPNTEFKNYMLSKYNFDYYTEFKALMNVSSGEVAHKLFKHFTDNELNSIMSNINSKSKALSAFRYYNYAKNFIIPDVINRSSQVSVNDGEVLTDQVFSNLLNIENNLAEKLISYGVVNKISNDPELNLKAIKKIVNQGYNVKYTKINTGKLVGKRLEVDNIKYKLIGNELIISYIGGNRERYKISFNLENNTIDAPSTSALYNEDISNYTSLIN